MHTSSNQKRRPTELDMIDLLMLKRLRRDGRMSISELAAAVHVSRATAYARLEKLTASGVLTGYTAQVDMARMGLDIAAVILISARQAENTLQAKVQRFPEVEYFAFLAGPFDAIAIVRAADMATLRDVVLRKFQQLPEIRSTQTLIVLQEATHVPFVLPQAAEAAEAAVR
jgi:DNA-binding Lrp family transcriptional regulator